MDNVIDNIILVCMVVIVMYMCFITWRQVQLKRKKRYTKKIQKEDTFKMQMMFVIIEMLLILHVALLYHIHFGRW